MSEYDDDRQVPCSVCGAADNDPCVDLDHAEVARLTQAWEKMAEETEP